MKDIAAHAGVAQSTVSRILSDTTSAIPVSASTRQRVLAATEELGYRPNPLARGLRGAGTRLLGVIVRDITDPFFAGAVEGVSAAAQSAGYNVVLGHAHAHADEAIELHHVLEARHCDAILLLGDVSETPRLLEDLRRSRTPLVAMWQGSRLSGIGTVDVDNRFGIVSMLDHLVDMGHDRIAFIYGRPLGDIRQRRAAFIEHMARLGLRVPRQYIRHVANDFRGGEVALHRLMDLLAPPTAVVAATDVLAIGALHASFDRGLKVPRDVSVAGFDDIPVAAVTVPSLTTVRMPVAEMAATAVQQAIDASQATTGSRPTTRVIMRPTLVVRQSSAPPMGKQAPIVSS